MVALPILGVLRLVLLASGREPCWHRPCSSGGLALGRISWPRWRRAGLAVLALGPVAGVHPHAAQDWPRSPARLLAVVVLCLVVYGGTTAAPAQSLASTPGATLPRVAG